MVADSNSDVAFIIMMAGPGVNGGQIVVQQLADLMKAQGQPQAAIEKTVQAQVDTVNSPWYKFFITHDPAPALSKVKIPVLALFGGKDVQVSAALNEPAVKAALAQGGNTQVTTKVYPSANHLFQPATTGGIDEYAKLKTFVPGFLDDMVAWIKGTIK